MNWLTKKIGRIIQVNRFRDLIIIIIILTKVEVSSFVSFLDYKFIFYQTFF